MALDRRDTERIRDLVTKRVRELLRIQVRAGVGGGGEANTGANLGSGQGVYGTKVGVQLRFKSLVEGTGVTMTSDANEITINASGSGGGGDSWLEWGM